MEGSFHPSRREMLGLGLGVLGVGAIGSGSAVSAAPPGGETVGGGGAPVGESRLEAPVAAAAGVEYLSYSGLDFKAGTSSLTYGSSSGELSTTAGFYTVPVSMPQGATVTEVVLYFTESVAAANVICRLVRYQGHTSGSNFNSVVIFDTSLAPVSGAMQSIVSAVPAGEVVDNTKNSYFLILNAAAGCTVYGARVGFRRGASITTSFVPLNPGRVYDSRWAVFGAAKINGGENRAISVKDRRRISPDDGAVDLVDFVPAGARAIAYNLTITETVNAGFLAATPGDATTFAASTINWSQTGQNLANGTVVTLDGSRNMKVFSGGLTHFIIDVLGYYI